MGQRRPLGGAERAAARQNRPADQRPHRGSHGGSTGRRLQSHHLLPSSALSPNQTSGPEGLEAAIGYQSRGGRHCGLLASHVMGQRWWRSQRLAGRRTW